MAEIEDLKIVGGSTYTVGNQDIIANAWEAGKTYVKNRSYVIQEHRLYVCNVTHISVEPFDADNWTEITIGDAIGNNIGDLSTLTTTKKSSLVGAVNEVDGKISGSETIYSGGSTFVNNIGTAFSISPYDLRDYKFLRVTGYSSSIGSSQRFVLLLPNNYTALTANYYSCAVGGVLAVARIESTNGTFTLLNFTINGSVPTNGAMIGEIIGIKA